MNQLTARPLAGVLLVAAALLAGACNYDTGSDDNNNQNQWTPPDGGIDTEIDPDCASVRLTAYTASRGGWCEFSRDLSILPVFVRDGMTTAIAEPWNGGSYDGPAGQACGECWEVATSWATQIVMVHDLCPIQGNPLCASSQFHFDLSTEAAQAVQGGGLDAAVTRRVPCPVSGNIHAEISDWNEWGYTRMAFVNHRVPLRAAAIRGEPGGDWVDIERSGGAWHVLDGPQAAAYSGVSFRLTSVHDEVVESSVVSFADVTPGGARHVVDLGMQMVETQDPTGMCRYIPFGLVYGDEWGGMDEVKWLPNPWGDTQVSETGDGCHGGSASCLRVDQLGNWSGMHIYQRQAFPTQSFATLSLQVRTLQGTTTVSISASHEGTRCAEREVELTPEWTEVLFDLDNQCELTILSAVTLSSGAEPIPILLDEIRFEEGT